MFKYLREASKHFVFYDLRFTDPKSDYERFKNHFETAKNVKIIRVCCGRLMCQIKPARGLKSY